MHRPQRVRLGYFIALLGVAGLLMVPAAGSNSGKRKVLTGTWETQIDAPFIMDRDAGGPAPSWTQMTWRLIQDSDGLLVGTNTFISYGPDGETEGVYCLVGARQKNDFVISEAPSDDPYNPQVVFTCKVQGRHKFRCLGTGLTSLEPLAISATLVRSAQQTAAEVLPELEICRDR